MFWTCVKIKKCLRSCRGRADTEGYSYCKIDSNDMSQRSKKEMSYSLIF